MGKVITGIGCTIQDKIGVFTVFLMIFSSSFVGNLEYYSHERAVLFVSEGELATIIVSKICQLTKECLQLKL